MVLGRLRPHDNLPASKQSAVFPESASGPLGDPLRAQVLWALALGRFSEIIRPDTRDSMFWCLSSGHEARPALTHLAGTPGRPHSRAPVEVTGFSPQHHPVRVTYGRARNLIFHIRTA